MTSGATPIPSTGSALANIDVDLGAALNALDAAGSNLAMAVWVMRARSAIHLARVRGTGGAPAFPFINARGGSLLGLPVVVSNSLPLNPPTGDATSIALIDPAGIALADDGEAELGVAMEASIQMVDDPVTGAAQKVSCWSTATGRAKLQDMAGTMKGVAKVGMSMTADAVLVGERVRERARSSSAEGESALSRSAGG